MEWIKRTIIKLKAFITALWTVVVITFLPFIQNSTQGCKGSCATCGGSCISSIVGVAGIGIGAYFIGKLGNNKKKQENKNEKV